MWYVKFDNAPRLKRLNQRCGRVAIGGENVVARQTSAYASFYRAMHY